MDIGYGCFVIRFENRKDYLYVLLDGPWKIFDNYLVIQRWVPDFKPRKAKLSKMAVWVRLPDLSVEYFRDDAMKAILENVGKPLKLDRTTADRERGRFARAAVEVDLDKPLVTEIWVRDEVQYVEYEGLHVVCFGCAMVGHREQSCPLNSAKSPEMPISDLNAEPQAESEQPQQQTPVAQPMATGTEKRPYGSWMLVTRKKINNKMNGQKNAQQHSRSQTTKAHSNDNRFEALAGNTDSGATERVNPPRSHNEKGSSSRHINNIPRGGMQAKGRGNTRGGRRGGRSFTLEMQRENAWLNQQPTAGVFTFGGTQSPSGS
ncbi:uncharacterized protein LOC116032364 [Ipomoea triloba]|uniref:uncharacterized protein LOC116032364 n=1 Tax=Ipomoea triloba TaxID=35885 RepID=UPI00125E998D|nr:uncharacterized protein LOC116032364 [Ipomoea triloba]